MEAHPIADLFPMLAEDELAELAADIKQRGLLQPIVLDADGKVLDGRNRLAACQLAGIGPEFTTYDGDDPDGYALSVNIQRRNLTKGQQAMVAARALRVSETNTSHGSVANTIGTSRARIVQAATVLEFAPDLVESVIAGATGLDKAYEVARERKTAAGSEAAQLARLRAEDPELADKVVEGELTLPGAWAERKARAAEEERQRKVATQLLCDIVPALAQTRGQDVFGKYSAEHAAPGRKITRAVIADAVTALEEMAKTWQERELP